MPYDKTIVLMRHGTAKKNIDNEHGGTGSALVEIGIGEVKKAARNLLQLNCPFQKIYYANRKQCSESASILSTLLRLETEKLDCIEPFNLGVLDGLSELDAKEKYPSISANMDLWRNGEIDISQLAIPGATDPRIFYNQCFDILSGLANNHLIIIGTRSLLVAFASILLGRKPIPSGGYVEIPWENSMFAVFYHTEDGYKFDSSLSTNHISE